jgi:hypothetical protein
VPTSFLLAAAPEVLPGEPAELHALLKVAEPFASVSSSRLRVTGSDGEVVAEFEDAFGLPPTPLSGPRRLERHELCSLAPGTYVATWSVDEVSAPAEFRMLDARPGPRPPELRLLAVPGSLAPQLAFQYRSAEEHDLAAALLGSTLVVDNVAHEHRGATWDGWATLPAGEWTWGWLALADYGVAGPIERVPVELRYGGLTAVTEL